MRPLTQVMLVVLMAFVVSAQNPWIRTLSTSQGSSNNNRADFLRLMKERANTPFTVGRSSFDATQIQPRMPSLPTRRAQQPSMPSTIRMPTGPDVNRPASGGRMMMADDFNDGRVSQEQIERDREIARQDRERQREEKERQREELELARQEAEQQREMADKENQEKFREQQLALEEKLRNQQAALEEQRLQREQAEKERHEQHQADLESQRQALEEHRLAMENHRKEMEEAQRQREHENQEKFREQQLALEEKLKAQEQALREQENAQREFESNQRAQEEAQREFEMAGGQDIQEFSNSRMLPMGVNVGRIVESKGSKGCIARPCQNNASCIDLDNGLFECTCAPGFTGLTCDIALESTVKSKNVCSDNPCLNQGSCEARELGFFCKCNKPWTGDRCEKVWENPCTEKNLRSSDISQFKDPWNEENYILCTDINIFHSMPCSKGTYFNEDYGHCVRVGYFPPVCPRNHCKNEASCIMDENDEFKCVCKKGFSGEFCETNINECETEGGNAACAGGKCVDQLNGFFCQCQNGLVGLNCVNTIPNPCTFEAIEQSREFHVMPTQEGRSYIHCTHENHFVLNKCAEGLFWNQEERACVNDRPKEKTGSCMSYPCKNGGDCQDLGDHEYTCACKNGYEGDQCETMIDSCASNPCQNGGRCLAYAGGYTCACHDKIVDECCCHGIKNPCPKKSSIIPGVNNYFPHLFTDRYIHCDFDGRAFARQCSAGLKWSQSSLSCLPENFVSHVPVVEPETTELFVDDSVEKMQMEEEARKKDLEERRQALMQRSNEKVKSLRYLNPRFIRRYQMGLLLLCC